MKIFNKLAILAAGIVMGFGVIQTEAKAASFSQIIDIDAKQNSASNPIALMLSAGTYSVEYIGMDEGGAYSGWNAWGRVDGCDINGENCRRGWLNGGYGLSFDGTTQVSGTTNVYANVSQAMQNAVDSSFILTSDKMVNFFMNDSFYDDNVGGISLKLSSNSNLKSVPEPASLLALFTVATIAVSTLKGKKLVA